VLDIAFLLNYSVAMRAIFIADAHLKKPDDLNYRTLCSFLQSITGNTDLLVIAGDFFEFWLGDSPEAFPHYHEALESLKAVSRAGARIVYIEGNHDFHLGAYFRHVFSAEVYPDETAIEVDGRRIYLCHGDLINSNDYSYMALRFIFRNPLTRLLAKVVPCSFPAWVAKRLGDHSKGKHTTVAEKWDASGLIREFARKKLAEGFDLVVTAHYHRPFIEDLGEGKTLLALGDWITQFSFGEMVDGKLNLRRYTSDIT
jgi:UDP-2,3-diacylglucosamine hydrolase